MSIDWLEFSVWEQPHSDVELTLTGYVEGEFVDVDRGMLGYEQQRVGPGGARVLWSERRPEVHVVLTGTWCRATSEAAMRGALAYVCATGPATRCDVAADDWSLRVAPGEVRDAILRGEAVTHTRSRHWHEDLATGGGTLYVGAASSRQRLRVYDKAIESGGEIAAVRWEVQTRDEAAESLPCKLALQNWGEVWRSRVVQIIDFRERGISGRPTRCPRSEWFAALVGDAQKARVYEAREPRTVEEVQEWISRQVAPSLAAVVAAKGGDLDYMTDLIALGRSRWRLKHEKLATSQEGNSAMDEQNSTPAFDDLSERLPFEWPSLRADTWVWCLHCERCFRFIDSKVDPADGLLMCGYWPDCDGSALDYWPWSHEDWEERMEGQERPEHWPEVPEAGVRYPLYPE